jgi:3-oxoacyl-[acyl-carrier protein] reductase
MRLKHKVSIITGAVQGIGLATALKFAEEGATVVACDLKPQGVDAAVSLVRARRAQAMGFALNVTDRAALDLMAAAVKERFVSIDVLVNNAGTTKKR